MKRLLICLALCCPTLLLITGCDKEDDYIPPAVERPENPQNGDSEEEKPAAPDHSVKTIVLADNNPIELGIGERAPVRFSVTPTDAEFRLADASLTVATGAGAGTKVTNYLLAGLSPVYDSDSTLLPGQYQAYVQDQGLSYGYDDRVRITIVSADGKGDSVSAQSAAITVQHKMRTFYQTKLPVLFIDTPNKQAITSKTTYIENTHIVLTLADGTIDHDGTMSIRGRGNSSWGQPKKPYRLKLDDKAPLMGEAKDRSWVLIANYSDKTLMRNYIAFYMSELSNLDYSPRAHFVELWLNGKYNGTYLLCEKLKISKHRVNVGDDGFLLEVDGKADASDVTFRTDHLGHPVNIKDPDVTRGDADYTFVRDYVRKAENALYGSSYTNPTTGWQAYMDMDSFADWFLINEIARNVDAQMYTSCYMNMTRTGKLKMGPVWDFDLGFGNADYNDCFRTSGYHIKPGPWFQRLFKDPAFVNRVKERFSFFYSHKADILAKIDETAAYLDLAAKANDDKWHTFGKYVWPNYFVGANYAEDVDFLKDWISKRMDWLKSDLGV